MTDTLSNIGIDTHQRLRSLIVDQIDAEAALNMDVRELERVVGKIIADAVSSYKLFLNGFEQHALTREIVDDMVRLGPIQACMDDPEVSDVLINGPKQVLVERRGKLEETRYTFRDESHLLNLAQR